MTTKTFFRPAMATLLPLAMGLSSQAIAAGFIEDSQASLELRNFYFQRDIHDDGTRNNTKREEWAQGFILDLRSGFTQGPLGFGVDALGMLGVRLDSSTARSNTGLLPRNGSQQPEDDYSKLGVTGKLRFAQTQARIGTLLPKMPTLQYSNSRLLPQTFRGWQVQSLDFKPLTLTVGDISSVVQRNASGHAKLRLNNKNSRFGGTYESDHLRFANFDLALPGKAQLSYHVAELEDIYRQHYLGLTHSLPLANGLLKTDLRAFHNEEAGQARAGDIDSGALNAMFGYSHSGHTLSAAYQRITGEHAFTYVDGAVPYLVNFLQTNDFAGPKERSWQLRYDYDFKHLGIPGLSLMTRYVSGSDIELAQGRHGKEWERNTDLAYAFQGTLKNLSVRYRNATYRTNFTRGLDEHRLILSYNLALW